MMLLADAARGRHLATILVSLEVTTKVQALLVLTGVALSRSAPSDSRPVGVRSPNAVTAVAPAPAIPTPRAPTLIR